MLKLCGFAVSNYHNKVKFALLEKDIPFEEEQVFPTSSAALIAKSPLGKIPYIETEQGVLVESQVVVDYLEARYPQRPLIPADPFAAAKVRELLTFLELHMELVARQLYGEAFFGGRTEEAHREKVRALLKKNVAGFARLAKFAPFVGGAELTMADCAATFHLPVIAAATSKVLGGDVLADLPVKQYLAHMEQNPIVARLNVERVANYAAFAASFKP